MLQALDFVRGINYWPARKAMYWWKAFDRQEAEADFKQLSGDGFEWVRIFLLWEDFQPAPEQIDAIKLNQLSWLADMAYEQNLQLMPTFFCGHMSGINWLPSWAVDPAAEYGRFPICNQQGLQPGMAKNFYVNHEVQEAQAYQIEKVCSALQSHPAIIAYDLGNESSNVAIAPHRESAQHWLQRMSQTIKKYSRHCAVTLGMHAEDLEEDRQIRPQDAAPYVDFISMHAYPFYLDWVKDPLDAKLAPFLGELTWQLAQKPVLFQECGAPTIPTPIRLPGDADRLIGWSKKDVQHYYQQLIPALERSGMLGFMAWCYADYHPSLWSLPPLDKNIHERFFGLYHYDGSSKNILNQLQESDSSRQGPPRHFWDHIDVAALYRSPRRHLSTWFERYRKQD